MILKGGSESLYFLTSSHWDWRRVTGLEGVYPTASAPIKVR